MSDYNGKTVYIGIDVHKKSYAVLAICEGEVIKRATLGTNKEELLKFFTKHFSQAVIYSVYEAGFSGFSLHRYLVNHGINNIVVNAASVEISARDRVKTDKRDALKLATQLSVGRLRGIHVPTVERDRMRTLTRTRCTLSKEKCRMGNRMKSLLHYHGLFDFEDDKAVNPRWVKEVAHRNYPEEIKYQLAAYARLWLQLADEIKKLDKKLAEQAKKDPVLEMIYQSAPGIGPVHARELANELGDMSHFKTLRLSSVFFSTLVK